MLNDFLPPTENLYKFITISGLFFIVLSFYPTYLRYKVNEQRYDVLKDRLVLETELKYLDQDIADFKEKLNLLGDKQNKISQLKINPF